MHGATVKKKQYILFDISVVCLREECRLRLFNCTVLRKIFGPKRGEVTGE